MHMSTEGWVIDWCVVSQKPKPFCDSVHPVSTSYFHILAPDQIWLHTMEEGRNDGHSEPEMNLPSEWLEEYWY